MQKKKHIFVLEDNLEILKLYKNLLESLFEVSAFSEDKSFYDFVMSSEISPDLFVTDLYLDGTNVFDLCEKPEILAKLKNWPVLVVSVKDDIQTMQKCLQEWANDYLVKPFNNNELIYKCSKLAKSGESIEVDPKSFTVIFGELKSLELSAKEFQILSHLIDSHAPVDKSELIEKIWGIAYSPNILNSTLGRLRKKLKPIDHSVTVSQSGRVILERTSQDQ